MAKRKRCPKGKHRAKNGRCVPKKKGAARRTSSNGRRTRAPAACRILLSQHQKRIDPRYRSQSFAMRAFNACKRASG